MYHDLKVWCTENIETWHRDEASARCYWVLNYISIKIATRNSQGVVT